MLPAVASTGFSNGDSSDPFLCSSASTSSIPAAQTDSQVVATPGIACTPLQSLDDFQAFTIDDAAEQVLGLPVKLGSVSSQEFLSATEPFSVILEHEPMHDLHSRPQPAAFTVGSVLGASDAQAGGALSHDAVAQTRSSLPCKRTAWNTGRSSSRAPVKLVKTCWGHLHCLRSLYMYFVILHLFGLAYCDRDQYHLREGPTRSTLHYRVRALHLALWRKPPHL